MLAQFYRRIMPTFICSLAALFYVYDYFIQVSPAVITEQLMREFAIGAPGLSFLGACFFYAYAIMQMPAGLLLDRFGARKLLSIAILISGCGVTLFAITSSFAIAGLARFMIGFGSAFAFISTLFLAARWFSHQYFALIAGLVQFAGCVGSMVGEAPLAAFINKYGWRQSMLLAGLVTLVLAILYWLIIRDHRDHSLPNNIKTTAMSEWQRLLAVFKIPQVWWVGWCGFFCWVPVATIGALWGVPYLMKVYQWTNTQAAGFCSLFWIALGIGSPLIGWYSERIRSRKLPFYISFCAGLIGASLLLFAIELPVWVTGIALMLLGLCAAIQSLTFGIIKDILPANIFGTASGFINMMAIIAGGISQQLVGQLLAMTWDQQIQNGIPLYTLENYRVAILVLPLAAVAGLWVVAHKLSETNCIAHHNQSALTE